MAILKVTDRQKAKHARLRAIRETFFEGIRKRQRAEYQTRMYNDRLTIK